LRICHYLMQACQSMVAVDDRVLVQTLVIDRMVLGCPMLNSMHWPVPHLTVLAAIPSGHWARTVHACGTRLLDTVRARATPSTVCTHRVRESFGVVAKEGAPSFIGAPAPLRKWSVTCSVTRPHRNGKGTDCQSRSTLPAHAAFLHPGVHPT
jgi:hypothetical protein